MGILTILDIAFILTSGYIRDGIKHYANARKAMHISVNMAIYGMEITSILFVHEAVLLHVGIPTAIVTWETILVKIAE